MASYFDDLLQYLEMSKVCAAKPPSSADVLGERASSVSVDVGASSLSQPAAGSANVMNLQRPVAPPQAAAADDDDPYECSCVVSN